MAKETTKKTAAPKSASAIVAEVKETAKESKVAKEVKEKVKETATKVKETASKVKETASKTAKKTKEASFVEFEGKQLRSQKTQRSTGSLQTRATLLISKFISIQIRARLSTL